MQSAAQTSEPCNPRQMHETLDVERLTLPTVRTLIPRTLKHPSELRSWLTLLRIALCSVACVTALAAVRVAFEAGWWWSAAFVLPLWALYGLVLVGVFVQGHECGHNSFSQYRWLNRWVGFLCMSPMLNGFHTWCLTHNHHHAYTQLRGQEVDWSSNLRTEEELEQCTWRQEPVTRLGYAVPYGLVLWVAWNTLRRALSVKRTLGAQRHARERAAISRSNGVMAVVYLGVYAAYWVKTGFWGMFYYHGVPLFIAFLVGALIITLGHASSDSIIYEEDTWTPLRGQLVATQNIRLPRWIEWLICDINIHIPHHVDTRIPWYHLREAGDALRAGLPMFYREERFGWKHVAWIRRTPHLRRQDGLLRIAS